MVPKLLFVESIFDTAHRDSLSGKTFTSGSCPVASVADDAFFWQGIATGKNFS